jgi:uncharacterized protein YneF (UPF0154 family)
MNEWVKTIIIGLCTGFGSAVGIYFANKHLIEKLEKVNKMIKVQEKKKEESE